MDYRYENYYDRDYWEGTKRYRNVLGEEQLYRGPALRWHAWTDIAAMVRKITGCPSSVLDIGCSAGEFVSQLTPEPYGVEISQYAIDNCVDKMKGRIALADISTSPVLPDHFPKTFPLVSATDLLEHIWYEDLPTTFDWICSKSERFLFFLIAICPKGQEFVWPKGKPIPPEFQSVAAAGHINVRTWGWWVKFFVEKGLTVRWDLMLRFAAEREKMPDLKNLIQWGPDWVYILEKPE